MKEILLVILELTLPVLLGYIIWLLKQQRKDRKNNSNGTMFLLRRALIEDYERYIKLEYIPHYAYQNFLDMYKAYHALGGNGVVTKMLEEINELHFNHKEEKK
ncbi:MAG: hypothetical protein IJ306_08145 [Oscillospiraceae bacterium]|nr:hypothetical protein [Oscillospiraceae bacterium]